jgi:hypothetical protein
MERRSQQKKQLQITICIESRSAKIAQGLLKKVPRFWRGLLFKGAGLKSWDFCNN